MDINNPVQNNIEISPNQEEKQISLTHEENENRTQNSPIQNTSTELKKETTEEETKNPSDKIIKESPKKESGKKTPLKNSVKPKNKQKSKSNVNPFLVENAFENKKRNTKIKHQRNKNSKRSLYFINYNNEISDLKDQNSNKSVFSRISEIMYKNTKEEKYPKKKETDLEKEKEKNYDKFTEDAFLISEANKTKKKNKKIIKEFLERKKKEEISDRCGFECEKDKQKDNELEPFQDSKRVSIITDRNISFKPKRTFKEFYDDQKIKEEKHLTHLKDNEKIQQDKLSLTILDKPVLNEETIKIANKGNRNNKNNNSDIHQRLYEEFNEIKIKKEKNEKEKLLLNKKEEKKISNVNIQKNVERLYTEYETKKKIIDENEQKKEKEIKIRSSSRSASKTSNQIIFKRFKKNLENAFKNIINKKLEENFEINFNDFAKLLYTIQFTTKNYYELIERKKNKNIDEDTQKSQYSLNNNNTINTIMLNQNKFELDTEYKLLIDSWKIITKNKTFKEDILGPSQRTLIFLLSVLGIYDGNDTNIFIKKEFPFLISDTSAVNKYSNLCKQIYKYFSVYKNNAINGLLFREKDNKRREEIKQEEERLLTFNPSLLRSSKKYIKNSNSVNHMRLSVEKDYQQYKKNKELKLKEKEKILESEQKEKCPFVPSGAKNKPKQDVSQISKRLFLTGLKHLKVSNSTYISNNNSLKYENLNENTQISNHNYKKMFNNNPLAFDLGVKKKLLEMEESRNKRAFDKLILKKGFKPKENEFKEYLYTEESNKRGRFALEDELSNTFKNTFRKFEKKDKRESFKTNREKYEFEIIVNRKPVKLTIYKGDDINCKVKEFCNTYNLNFNDKRRIFQTISNQINN